MNLKSVLEETASRYGEKDAIVYGDRRLSYSDLNEASNKFASALLNSGIGKGDRIALFLSNSPEFLISFFGITKIGAIALPLDQQYKLSELTSIINHALPAAIVSESTALDTLGATISDFRSVKTVVEVTGENRERFIGFDDYLSTAPVQRIEGEPSPDDTAVIMYTSFSSFQPKGVMLSHRSLIMEAAMSSESYHQTDKDIMMLFALPMFHVFGLIAAALSTIYTGGTIVLVPGTGISISSFMAAIEREKGTMFLGVPYIFALAVDLAEREGINNDLNSLRLCASAGAPLSTSTAQRFRELYGYEIMDCYGLTEAVCHVTCPSINGASVSGSIGKPLSGWDIKIVNSDGKELPAGQPGEIIVRGPIMRGYYNNPAATNDMIKDGWLYSGDIGMADEDGNLYVTGREKDTIIVKGQNIYPEDVEGVIAAHPGVAEVAVMGLPDKMRGEIIGAAVCLREGVNVTEHDIRQYCLERIASYKAPKQVIFTGPMPRKPNGEIDKDAVRKKLSLPPVFPVL